MTPRTTRLATPAATAAPTLVLNEMRIIAGSPGVLLCSALERGKQRRNAFLLGRIGQPPGGANRLQAQFNFACHLARRSKTESLSGAGDIVSDLNEIGQIRNRRLGGEEPPPEI